MVKVQEEYLTGISILQDALRDLAINILDGKKILKEVSSKNRPIPDEDLDALDLIEDSCNEFLVAYEQFSETFFDEASFGGEDD